MGETVFLYDFNWILRHKLIITRKLARLVLPMIVNNNMFRGLFK